MRSTGWLQAGVIMLVLGIFVGLYGLGIWALMLGEDTDADAGAKIASPIMMLCAVPLLVVGLGMSVSGVVWERRLARESADEAARTPADAPRA